MANPIPPRKTDEQAAQDVADLRHALELLQQKNATLESRNAQLAQITQGRVELPEHEQPQYLLTAPYYSPDDVYYPEGVEIRDVLGTIIPNEHMIPKNQAAHVRLEAYLSRLPSATKTPTMDLIIQAAMEERPREGDDPAAVAQYYGRVLARAKQLQMEGAGAGMTDRIGHMPAQLKAQTIMPNTRISGQPSYRRQAQTALHADAVMPANSGVPAIGSSRSDLLGNPHGGLRA